MEEGDTVVSEEGLMEGGEEGSADSMKRENSGEKEEDHHKPGRKSSPKRPYLCSDCGWWLARPREVGCPFCVGGAPAPRRRLAGEEQPALKSKKKEADKPYSNKRLINVWNVGQSKNSTIPKKQEGATRFVCISDTHNRHDDLSIPKGDVLIHSGDFTLSGSTKEVEDFVEFMDSLPHPHKVVVAGNHDCVFDTEWYDKHYLRYHEEKAEAQRLKDMVTSKFIYLEDSLVEINGITIYGSPWTLSYHDWVFQFDKGEDIRQVWDLIPTGVDVLVTHNPPTGVKRLNLGVGGIDAGCSELKRAVARVKPRVHIFGHVHEGYGLFKSQPTTFINACSVNRAYKAVNKPIVFDLI